MTSDENTPLLDGQKGCGAGQRVAGQTVAGQTVAGQTVAGQTVASFPDCQVQSHDWTVLHTRGDGWVKSKEE